MSGSTKGDPKIQFNYSAPWTHCAANFRNPYGQYAAVVQLLIEAGEKVTNDRPEFAVANDLDVIATVLKTHGALL